MIDHHLFKSKEKTDQMPKTVELCSTPYFESKKSILNTVKSHSKSFATNVDMHTCPHRHISHMKRSKC